MRSLALRPTMLRRNVLPAHEVQIAYLTQSARLEETVSPRLVRMTAILISLSILGFIGWAAVTNINEIARTAGEVVPAGYEQSVQHLDGGRVRDLFVTDGALVDKGAPLLLLEGIGTTEDLARARRRNLGLQLRQERLRAFVESREPDFRAFKDVAPQEIEQQMQVFRAMMDANAGRSSVAEDQVRQRARAIEILKVRRNTIVANLTSLRDLLEKRRELFRNGHLSKIQLLDTEQRVTTLSGDLATVDQQMKEAADTVSEYESRQTSLLASQLDDAYQELEQISIDLDQNIEVIRKLERAQDRLTVRAPVRGVVKGLTINTIGAVVQPGQALLEIVPVDEELIVETRIAPQYIGHVHIGQPVEVKVSAYDVSRYGSIDGELIFVSATTFADPDGRRYYRGRVRLNQDHAGDDPTQHRILPGMTAMVEIITGEKTILEYLLKPVNVALSSAFSER